MSLEPLICSGAAQFRRSSRIKVAMEKIRDLKLVRIVDKLQVSGTEPGLTNAQLMLTNFDLKPGSYNLLLASIDLLAAS